MSRKDRFLMRKLHSRYPYFVVALITTGHRHGTTAANPSDSFGPPPLEGLTATTANIGQPPLPLHPPHPPSSSTPDFLAAAAAASSPLPECARAARRLYDSMASSNSVLRTADRPMSV